jgi:uncharacterized repeat protein (TIGR02543 family)
MKKSFKKTLLLSVGTLLLASLAVSCGATNKSDNSTSNSDSSLISDSTVVSQSNTSSVSTVTKFAVSFSGGEGASGTAPIQTDVIGQTSIVLPDNTFTKTGYVFVGWSDGTNTYKAGASYVVKGNVAFTAVWSIEAVPFQKTGADLNLSLEVTSSGETTVKHTFSIADYVDMNNAQNVIVDLEGENVTFSSIVNGAFDATIPLGNNIVKIKVSQNGKLILTVSINAEVTNTSGFRPVNYDFETGTTDGWSYVGTDSNAFSISNNLTYFDSLAVAFGPNLPLTCFDGSYYLNGFANESWVGSFKSSTFTLGGTGWITFKLGGNSDENLKMKIMEVSETEGGTDTVVATFNNWLYFNAYRSMGLTKYAAKLDSLIGKKLYIVLEDNLTSNFGAFVADSFNTYYKTAPTIDFEDTFPAGFVTQPTYDMTDVLGFKNAPQQLVNGDFETGDSTGWINTGKTIGFYPVDGNTTEKIQGKYFLDGMNDYKNALNGSWFRGTIYSKAFTLGGTGWISFMMGGYNSADLQLQVWKHTDGVADAMVAQYTNYYNKVSDDGRLTTYASKLDASLIGSTLYFKIVDNANKDNCAYAGVLLDNVITYYDKEVTVDRATIFPAGYVDIPAGVVNPSKIKDFDDISGNIYDYEKGTADGFSQDISLTDCIDYKDATDTQYVFSGSDGVEGVVDGKTLKLKVTKAGDLTYKLIVKNGLSEELFTIYGKVAAKDTSSYKKADISPKIDLYDSTSTSVITKNMDLDLSSCFNLDGVSASFIINNTNDKITFSAVSGNKTTITVNAIGRYTFTVDMLVDGEVVARANVTLLAYDSSASAVKNLEDQNADLYDGTVLTIDLSKYFNYGIYDNPSFAASSTDASLSFTVNNGLLTINMTEIGDKPFTVVLKDGETVVNTLSATIHITDTTEYHRTLGQETNPIVLSTPDQVAAVDWTLDKYYVLANDIDMTGKSWNYVQNFYGHLDGKGYKITNLTQSAHFAFLAENMYGSIKNLEACNWTSTYADFWWGTFCFSLQAGGVIDNVYLHDMTLASCTVMSGVVINDFGSITNVLSSINISATAKGAGICLAVNKGTLSNIVYTGTVTGTENHSGTYNHAQGGADDKISNCFYLDSNSTPVDVSTVQTNVVAVSSTDMTSGSATIFTGLDTTNYWVLTAGSIPMLKLFA